MKEGTKILIKNYAVYFLILFIFGIISFFLFKIPYIGKELLGIDASFFFATSVYHVNPYIYIFGNLFFGVVFILVWFGILNNKLNTIRKISRVAYWIGLGFFALFLVFEYVIYVLAQLTSLGLSFYLKNGYLLVDILPLVFMFVTVLISTIYTLKRGVK